MTYVFYLALAFGFYMAWSIGSNDAANAMGTSVGSKAITFTEAIVIAAVFEFSGAILAGANVTNTMRKGIIAPEAFQALGPDGPALFALGMLAALVSAAVWSPSSARSLNALSSNPAGLETMAIFVVSFWNPPPAPMQPARVVPQRPAAPVASTVRRLTAVGEFSAPESPEPSVLSLL